MYKDVDWFFLDLSISTNDDIREHILHVIFTPEPFLELHLLEVVMLCPDVQGGPDHLHAPVLLAFVLDSLEEVVPEALVKGVV